ncbi:MAG TPA: hypothetical protein VLW25_09900 [Bryobacteraceae bacterium]|nr:hypothetical protein [Bryobacteraceae bacterium]
MRAIKGLAATCIVLGVTFGALASDFTNRYTVLYSTHAWMHAAPDYLVANGQLLIEEPDLAGVRLAYPWAGHAFQALLSYVLDSTPAYSYIWTGLLWIVVFYGLAAVLAMELGLSPLHAGFAPVWLFFGVNLARAVMLRIAPHHLHWLGGDDRYAIWVFYFLYPTQMLFALAMFVAMLVILVSSSFWAEKAKNLALLSLLLLGIGFVYPILFPAAAALVGGRIGAEIVQATPDRRIQFNRIRLLALLGASTTAVTVAYLVLMTRDRTTPAVLLSGFGPTTEFRHSSTPIRKALECLVATSPLLLGLVLSIRRLWRSNQAAAMVLCAGALASAALYSLLFIPYYQNEYKFMFTAAASLAVFPAIAMEPFMKRIGNKTILVGTGLTLLLSIPLFIVMSQKPFWVMPDGPRVRTDSFDLRLDNSQRFAGVIDAIRTGTPVQTVVVAEDTGVYLPTLTRRQLFVAPRSPKPYPGVAIRDDVLLKNVKGYSAKLIDSRRAVQDELFHAGDLDRISRSLERILDIKRPVAVIVDAQLQGNLSQLLAQLRSGRPLFQAQDIAAWLFFPGRPLNHRGPYLSLRAPTAPRQ